MKKQFSIFEKKVLIDVDRIKNKGVSDVEKALKEYESGKRTNFSDFEVFIDDLSENCVKVLKALRKIKFGEKITYSDLGKKLGLHARAVARACSSNPLPIIIPCHRVVGKADIGGYSQGKDLKALLLNFEESIFKVTE